MTFIFDSLIPRFGIPAGDEDMRLDDVENALNALTAKITSQGVDVSGILKRVKNRHKISLTDGTETFYDDDQQTIIQTNDLKDSQGDQATKAGDVVESVPR